MGVLTIRRLGDTILNEQAASVGKIDREIKRLLDDMALTMHHAKGVGLAAPQVGHSLRIIIVNGKEGLIELINPSIIAAEGCNCNVEGCLSIPGLFGEVERYTKVTVEGYNRDGKKITIYGQDLLARALQHEIDHLEGILFIERVKEVQKR